MHSGTTQSKRKSNALRRLSTFARRAVGYVRVSIQEQGLSEHAQRDTMKRWCEANGVQLAGVCTDVGVGGATDVEKRPGLLTALATLRQERAEVHCGEARSARTRRASGSSQAHGEARNVSLSLCLACLSRLEGSGEA